MFERFVTTRNTRGPSNEMLIDSFSRRTTVSWVWIVSWYFSVPVVSFLPCSFLRLFVAVVLVFDDEEVLLLVLVPDGEILVGVAKLCYWIPHLPVPGVVEVLSWNVGEWLLAMKGIESSRENDGRVGLGDDEQTVGGSLGVEVKGEKTSHSTIVVLVVVTNLVFVELVLLRRQRQSEYRLLLPHPMGPVLDPRLVLLLPLP